MGTMPTITAADVADDMKWLFDETPEPEDSNTSTWEKFLELDLVGCSVNFGCRGGDMHQVTGTIKQVDKEGDLMNYYGLTPIVSNQNSSFACPVSSVS